MKYKNVREPWEIHDTICVCNTLYGNESQVGFFPTFVAFSQREKHLFFKTRSEGNTHLAYNNQSAADRVDFVFHLFSVGVHFFGPPTPLDMLDTAGDASNAQDALPSFWTMDLPRHCGVTLRIGQDDKLSAQSMMLSPGYGPQFSGAGTAVQDLAGELDCGPELVWSATQGIPGRRSRFFTALDKKGKPRPISIPRNDIVEVSLSVSEFARDFLSNAAGPNDYFFDLVAAALDGIFPTRYGIQVSMYGYREVQQRGMLHN